MTNDRRKNRSDTYQPFIIEIPVSPNILGDLSSAQGMTYKTQPFQYSERILDLREQLTARMWYIIETGLTNRQKQVLELSTKGLTQNEIAKKLGINQTSVHKVIRGNIDYKNGKKRYGGALKKIFRLCQLDNEVQRILTEIRELYEYLEL